MSRFFIDHPVFAWVIAIVIMLLGGLSVLRMPVEQYPNVAPPKINISATYPGASAETLQDSVIQIIEQKMTGLDHLRYIESSGSSNGRATISVTFDGGTDPDIAQVQVQNKLQSAMALLPEAVQSQGVQVTKSSGTMLMVLGLVSEGSDTTTAELGDYLVANIQDPISRVNGVGEVSVFGSQFAMRIWLDPNKLIQFGMTSSDVISAVRAQNNEVSAGSLGAEPAAPGQLIDATIVAQGRFTSTEEFEHILLEVGTDGSRVTLGDVARVELGSESYGFSARYNGQPAAGLRIMAASGANALDTVAGIKARVDELSENLPTGLSVVYPVDNSPFVRRSIQEVVKTLIEAVVLVFVVMFLFLGNIRATLVPTLAVPVVVLGTFGVLSIAGYSINTLTLFGMVLAIGLLVDDAIVVVENVERVMEEEGVSPREAARISMDQITGALVGIGLVLCAAFLPMALFESSTGIIYRQFAITVSTAVALSVFVALVFSPALCATILKPPTHAATERKGFFGWFNRTFERISGRYADLVGLALRRRTALLVVYGGVIVAVALLFRALPTGFLPVEDTGSVFVMTQLPAGSTQEQTDASLRRVEAQVEEDFGETLYGMMAVTGFSFAGQGQNQSMTFTHLVEWEEREDAGKTAFALQGKLGQAFAKRRDATISPILPPAVRELGNMSGFDMRLVDAGGLGYEALAQAEAQLLELANESPILTRVRRNGLADKPQLRLDIDLEKAGALGLTASDINGELSNIFGSAYVNDFIDRGRVKKVYAQADAPYRMNPEDLELWRVRNDTAGMVPLSAVVDSRWEMGPPLLTRFNGLAALSIAGEPQPGCSSGDAMAEMQRLAAQLPKGIGVEWAGLSYEERLSGSNSTALYALALVMVFLCLAALYGSWAVPLAVLMDIPLGALGVLGATYARGFSNDIYFQVGLITIVGLSSKNAILVVEFAKERYDAGADLVEATIFSVKQRLRPIMMTSIAFGLGVLPLAISTGPGAASQTAVGTGVLGGAIMTTVLGLFFVPLYFVSIYKLFRVRRAVPPEQRDAPAPQPSQGDPAHA